MCVLPVTTGLLRVIDYPAGREASVETSAVWILLPVSRKHVNDMVRLRRLGRAGTCIEIDLGTSLGKPGGMDKQSTTPALFPFVGGFDSISKCKMQNAERRMQLVQ